MRFLLDANLSPKSAKFLRENFSFDALSLMDLGLSALADSEIIDLAAKEKRIIITLDLDFGKLYHEQNRKTGFGVIIIRARDQRRNNIHSLMRNLFSAGAVQKTFAKNPCALVVMEDAQIRTLM